MTLVSANSVTVLRQRFTSFEGHTSRCCAAVYFMLCCRVLLAELHVGVGDLAEHREEVIHDRSQRSEHNRHDLLLPRRVHALGVAVQAEFENPNFETSFSLHRFKGWVTRRFQAMGQLYSTCKAPPLARWSGRRGRRRVAVQVEFETQTLKKPGNQRDRKSLETRRLKPGAFQAMGQLAAPHRRASSGASPSPAARLARSRSSPRGLDRVHIIRMT
jgi:hypothetical protein